MRIFIFFIFFLILFSSLAFAIGVSPPTHEIDYKEGLTQSFDYKILNKDAKEISVRMWVSGAFSDYVTFSEETFNIPAHGTHMVTATLTLPDYNSLTDFGRQIVRLHASEQAIRGGMFVVATSVEPWIIVNVPIPGKYAEIMNFGVGSIVENYDTKATLVIKNRGTESFSNKEAVITIISSEGDRMDRLTISGVSLNPGEEKTYTQKVLSSDYPSAKYTALAEFTYSPEMVPSTKETFFFIGSTDVVLTNYTDTLVKGKINKINLYLQSLWGSTLSGIRGSVIVDGNEQLLPVIDFKPFEEVVVEAFIDVGDTNASSYNAILKLTIPEDTGNVETKEIPLSFKLVDSDEDLVVKKKTNTTPLLPIFLGGLVIVMILVILNIFLFNRGKKNEKK